MPDFTQLAAQAVAVLALALPYLDSVTQGVGKQIGVEGAKQAGRLLSALRTRFRRDAKGEAAKTLELFENNPELFQAPLAKLLAHALAQDPQWAGEIGGLLAGESVQEIIARNESVVQRISMELSGAGVQRIDSDASDVTDVKMRKK